MQWSDVIKPPPTKVLRQFAGLWLVVFLGFAALRYFGGKAGTLTTVMAVAAVGIGVPGLFVPALVRPIYQGWMIAAFPIGWTVARLVLGVVFYLVVTPLALVFRMMGRDVLRRRPSKVTSYWTDRRQSSGLGEYMRQF
jgi:hypothetical protein